MEQQLSSTCLQEDIASATNGSETNVRKPWLRFASLALFLVAAAALWSKFDPAWRATDGSMEQTILDGNSAYPVPPGYPPSGSPGYPAAGAAYPRPQGYPPAGSPGYPAAANGQHVGYGQPPNPPAGSPGYPAAANGQHVGYGQPPNPPAGQPGGQQVGYGQPGGQQDGYGQPPPRTYGAPPLGYGQPPPFGQYGQLPGAYPPPPDSSRGQQPPGQSSPQVQSPLVTSSGGQISGATVHPVSNFDAETDCEALRKAFRKTDPEESFVINLLASRSGAQRVEIRARYKTMFSKDIMDDLKIELSGNLEESLLAMMDPFDLYLARCLRKAMKGAGTDEETLIDILATLPNKEIVAVQKSYKAYYKRVLEKDCVSETSGLFKRLLVSLTRANRDESGIVDMAKATREAEDMYRSGGKTWGTDESRFTVLFANRGYKQLRATMDEYERMFHRTVLDTIKREVADDWRDGVRTIALVTTSPAVYFAERLWRSMKGAGTNDSLLIRLIVTRSEIDLEDIKNVFLAKYGKTLYKHVEGNCSGDYKKLLLALIKN